jgi:hypothetical protein
MIAGICLAMAVVHMLVWLRDRESWSNPAFALCSIAAAVTAVFELVLMNSRRRQSAAEREPRPLAGTTWHMKLRDGKSAYYYDPVRRQQ